MDEIEVSNQIVWDCFVVLMEAAQFRNNEIEPMGDQELFLQKFKHKLNDSELKIAQTLIELRDNL
tara:strand:+ start:49 stop:243 length:195 start_codon:yes stop_codon:yes gene_type:complete